MRLSTLLKEAGAASPMHRIEWRDPIAAHGARAIEGVRPWLADPVLAAFAIRVVERAGTNGEAALAAQVLRSSRASAPPAVVGDLDWALQRLRLRTNGSVPRSASPSLAPSLARPVRRQRPYLSTVVARRRAR
jgi:hypothetical protein